MAFSVSTIKMFSPHLLHIRAALNQDKLFSQTAKGSKTCLEPQQFGFNIPFLKLGNRSVGETVRDLVCIQIHSENGMTKERVRQGERERRGRVLHTKESCSTGVNT